MDLNKPGGCPDAVQSWTAIGAAQLLPTQSCTFQPWGLTVICCLSLEIATIHHHSVFTKCQGLTPLGLTVFTLIAEEECTVRRLGRAFLVPQLGCVLWLQWCVARNSL